MRAGDGRLRRRGHRRRPRRRLLRRPRQQAGMEACAAVRGQGRRLRHRARPRDRCARGDRRPVGDGRRARQRRGRGAAVPARRLRGEQARADVRARSREAAVGVVDAAGRQGRYHAEYLLRRLAGSATRRSPRSRRASTRSRTRTCIGGLAGRSTSRSAGSRGCWRSIGSSGSTTPVTRPGRCSGPTRRSSSSPARAARPRDDPRLRSARARWRFGDVPDKENPMATR